MRKARAFAEWLYGGFDDPYTWLIWICVISLFLTTGWRLDVVVAVEAGTVAMRWWTRDVVAEKRRKKEADRAA